MKCLALYQVSQIRQFLRSTSVFLISKKNYEELIRLLPTKTINECKIFVKLRSDNQTMRSKVVNAAFRRKPANYHRSPPFHPQSKGQAEQFVDTFEKLCKSSRPRHNVRSPTEVLTSVSPNTKFSVASWTILSQKFHRTSNYGSTLYAKAATEHKRKQCNYKMEDQFNSYNGARLKQFEPNDIKRVRDFSQRGERSFLTEHGRAIY